ncbi:formylglycine-generating enzyme family protein [Streptomyces sp. NPDC091272]|uniref:formylglycine-generating enzyme family protein n=1 Tax=Streptomyces sp. NPDC091272 TaxID=3365981 RepID=UPI00381E3BF4
MRETGPARADGTAAPEVAQLPGGRVVLSDRRTRRSWPVEMAPFRLATHPVTQGEYAGLTGERPSGAPPADRLPVESVSWLDAVRFCNALSTSEGLPAAYRVSGETVEWDRSADGYRLPTEAEWEYACRAGTEGPGYGPLDEIAWHRGNSEGAPQQVGGLLPNAWGLYDMLGNVWEWCWDVYDAEVYGTYRVLRGGGWFDERWSCRASVRRRSHPTLRLDDVGFRVARGAA